MKSFEELVEEKYGESTDGEMVLEIADLFDDMVETYDHVTSNVHVESGVIEMYMKDEIKDLLHIAKKFKKVSMYLQKVELKRLEKKLTDEMKKYRIEQKENKTETVNIVITLVWIGLIAGLGIYLWITIAKGSGDGNKKLKN